MREIVASEELELGMFVIELDRPWIDSPFALQGFLIEDEETLAKLKALCRFVSIDRQRSVREHFRAKPREDVASRVGKSLRGHAKAEVGIERQPGDRPLLPDFVEILQLIRSGRLDELPRLRSEDLVEPDRAGAPHLAESGHKARSGGRRADRPLGRLLDPLRGRHGGDAGRGATEGMSEQTRVERELVYVAPHFAETRGALDRVLTDIRENIEPDLGKLREGIEEMVRSVARNPDALLWLTRLRASDEGSYQHALHASVMMMVFARSLGMGEETTRLLGMAGILHDVGKVRLPARLLQKNARLTPLEYEIFKTHVDYSLAILKDSPEVTPELLEIVSRHHERIDGSGYPQGLAGDAIGLNAEIAGLVDSYVAMTNKRNYLSVFSTHQALEDLIRLRGTKHRATLVDQFVQCIGIYPVGSLVELNSGEVGVVIGQNRVRRLKPRVLLLLGPDKTPNRHPPVIDLLYEPGTPAGDPYAIVRALPHDAYGIDPQAFYLT